MRYILAAIVAVLVTAIGFAQNNVPDVIWTDFDMENIPEPGNRDPPDPYVFFKALFTDQAKQGTDIPRAKRKLQGKPKQAVNTNALDETPNSSWYTIRHHLHRMTLDELAAGPNRGPGPDLIDAEVVAAKKDGVTVGFRVKDQKGDAYLVKFDTKDYPELLSAAEVISTKIFYACGYNVPENYIAQIDIDRLQIATGVVVNGKPLTITELEKMLEPVARLPNGRYRVVASKLLPGKPKGPFSLVGLRMDDPNDLIPHEDRRELRGLRVIASWVNHWDLKETNTLDMYVEEGGRRFLRHHLIDFGSTMGGATTNPLDNYRGHEYGFDMGNIFKEVITGGAYESPYEKKIPAYSPATGIFRAQDFKPEHWKPIANVIPFENVTPADALWGTRLVLSFNQTELRRIVETGEYTDPNDTEYILRTLTERQAEIARYWLNKSTPLADFSVYPKQDGLELIFNDLAVDYRVAGPAAAKGYIYQISHGKVSLPKQTTSIPKIFVTGNELNSLLENVNGSASIEIAIWTIRKSGEHPVRVRLYDALTPTKTEIVQIRRS